MTRNQEERPNIPLNKLHETSVGYTIPRTFPGAEHVSLAPFDIFTFDFNFVGLPEIKSSCHQLSRYYSLHKLQNIRTLGIWFHKNHEMPDETLKWVVRLLKMNFASLTALKVVLVDCFSLTDKGMENLVQLARNLPQLKRLTIDFCCTHAISGKGLEMIGYELSRNLKNLESLSLCFGESYDNEKDPEFERLIVSMGKHFSRLKRLVLDFSGSEALTNEGLAAVVQQIRKNFKGLQKFDLVIVGCESMNYEDLRHIHELLSCNPQFNLITKSSW